MPETLKQLGNYSAFVISFPILPIWIGGLSRYDHGGWVSERRHNRIFLSTRAIEHFNNLKSCHIVHISSVCYALVSEACKPYKFLGLPLVPLLLGKLNDWAQLKSGTWSFAPVIVRSWVSRD